MNKKILIGICSLGIVSVAIILCIVLLLVPKNRDENTTNSLYVYSNVQNLNIKVGEEIRNFYSVSNPNAEITFELDKENIIDIDKYRIKGLQCGEVNVTIIATLNDEVARDTCKVIVSQEECKIKFVFKEDENCQFDEINQTLYLKGNSFLYQITLIDRAGNTVDEFNVDITTTNGCKIIDEFLFDAVIVEEDCEITFAFIDYDFVYTLSVKLI